MDFSPSEGRYELHISGASYSSDNGQFACRARRSGSGLVLLAETFNLTVLLAPRAPELRQPPPLVEGEPAQLVCSSVGGSPAPELRWYRRGAATPLPARLRPAARRSEPTEAILTLTPARQDDGAQLECVAWNRAMAAGERLAAAVQLTVHCESGARGLTGDGDRRYRSECACRHLILSLVRGRVCAPCAFQYARPVPHYTWAGAGMGSVNGSRVVPPPQPM